MKEYLMRLFNYNHWANEMLIEAIENQKIKNEYIDTIISHILNAQYLWFARFYPKNKFHYKFWDVHQPAKLKEMNDEIASLFIEYIANIKPKDLINKVEYTTTEGDVYFNNLFDIFVHIANHSAHHRGQITHKINELAKIPPKIDYIIYSRTFPDFW